MTESTERWRQVRRMVNQQRLALAAQAARLYPGAARAVGTDLLCRPEWLPAAPVELADIALHWAGQPPAARLDATADAAAHLLPQQAPGGPFPSYAAAVAVVDPPALFENRVCYRLLDATLSGPARLTMGPARYFDAMNLGHAVAHELAAAQDRAATPAQKAHASQAPQAAGSGPVSVADLPLRAALGDPCALSQRIALTAVTTLTLRRAADGTASFPLHWRDPARVNHAGGAYQVMPAGIFQPVTDRPAAQQADFSLWRCMTREFSEELLGGSEDYPTRDGVLDYGEWPFARELAAARDAGTLRVHCVGLGVDPLTLATDLLTVAVFDSAVFDRLFRDLVTANAEGRVVTENGSAAIPFNAATVARFTGGAEPMQTAGAALLRLAWQHRQALLG